MIIGTVRSSNFGPFCFLEYVEDALLIAFAAMLRVEGH